MNNRFVVITTCYNVNDYIRMNIAMNKYQSYKNVLYLYIDDGSTDGTYTTLLDETHSDDRCHVIRNDDNGSQGKAYMFGISWLQVNDLISDEDIIVEVDGDDWLSSVFTLQYISQIYTDNAVWMTYGQYQMYPSGETGGHYNMGIDQAVDSANTYRFTPFPFSHLKTYKYHLFSRIPTNRLTDDCTGEYFSAAWDHALCIPMVEMAGKDHIYRCDDILYILNRSADLNNEGSVRQKEQKEIEKRIRTKPPMDRIITSNITFDLKGPGAPGGIHNYGLGNLMFQVATGISMAKDNDATLILPQLKTPQFGGYTNNIFSKIRTTPSVNHTMTYEQPEFTYSDTPFYPNCKYSGYFQSEKFFVHNRQAILNMFKHDDDMMKPVQENLSTLLPFTGNVVSIHVRRGDYTNLSEMHPILPMDYYKNAIDYFDSSALFLIFSDDIDWCMNNELFSSLSNKHFVCDCDDYLDLLIMSECNHNIIANSTFSWWGAWLNENPDKVVIAPKQWFGEKRNLSDKDIIPESWIKI